MGKFVPVVDEEAPKNERKNSDPSYEKVIIPFHRYPGIPAGIGDRCMGRVQHSNVGTIPVLLVTD